MHDHVVADTSKRTAAVVGRCGTGFWMLEREGRNVIVGNAGCRLVDLRTLARRDRRRPVEPVAGIEQRLLDPAKILRRNEFVGLVENKGTPVAAGFGELGPDQVLD